KYGVSSSEPMAMISAVTEAVSSFRLPVSSFTWDSTPSTPRAPRSRYGESLCEVWLGSAEVNLSAGATFEIFSAISAGLGGELFRSRMETLFHRKQRQALDAPGDVVDGVVGGEHGGPAGSKGEADETLSGNHQRGLLFGSDLHNSAAATQGGSNVQVAVHIEGQTLGTSQAAVEHLGGAVRIHAIDGIEAGGGWAGDKEVAIRAERQVIGGDAGLQRGKDKNLALAVDLENGSAAVADVEVFFTIECQPGGDAHAFGVSGHGPVRRHAIDSAVVARGDVHLSGAIEGNGGGIHHFA